ncbi:MULTISPECIES: CPBP family intramembrane glutamic endopeptidase [unclassified Microbacterium]|uniref:CPBP family intramembrane glutamic endopeptidase n=1 Tax=Microbacterium TaxID=33882 RepID=UPI003BA3B637
MTSAESMPETTRVPWGAVATFLVIAFALAWVVTLPLWIGGEGLRSPLALPLMAAMMWTPTVAALVATFFVRRPRRRAHYLGLVPFRPVGRKIALFLLFPVAWTAIAVASLLLAAALGWAHPDWSLSQIAPFLPEGMTADVYMAVTLAAIPVNTVVATVSAFGEELGWRGFLTTALAPLGFWPSAILIGIVWGLWHAPVILLGYNFARPDAAGLALMVVFTLFVGVILQWSRYWTGNVWPAAVGHGALNTAASVVVLWNGPGDDAAIATVLGAPGWIVMGVVIALLVVTGLLGRRTRTALEAVPA